ncbi:uncharacterized protein TM35_000043640 [Trypanosoma theileri]|uniref:Uncharacterized protein n=1 Tax=Trypanosoma theileri TaxID=67003 RepID=A0A1X0P6U1_9TRYP|nr:uncharacterized protein TM35_000043640 [Trypanosoma theileri]ORC92150.1 hypothetical protein TM35_000043640 [Trypanosoma theileri]
MPDGGQQVYWHDIPRCPPPWRATAAPTRREVVLQRRCERATPPPCGRHWGIVLEPYLTPLHGLNMVMRELQVAAVTREEAAAAVATVSEELNAMTQQLPSQSPSQRGRQFKEEGMTQQSSATAMDVREAPLLEVVKVLCATRGLEVIAFSKAELRLKKRIGLADVLPRKRVVMAFDRSKPLFVFLTAVMVKKKKWGTTTQAKFLNLVAPTSNPVPWRRLLRGAIPNFPLNECVLVAVQRCHDDYTTEGFPLSNGLHEREEFLLGGDDSDGDNNNYEEEEEEEDMDEDKGENSIDISNTNQKYIKNKGEEIHKGRKRGREEETEENSYNDSHGGDSDSEFYSDETNSVNSDNMSRDGIPLGPNPIFTERDQLHDDPLFETPVAVFRKVSRAAHAKHDWIQRLIKYKERKQLYAINY